MHVQVDYDKDGLSYAATAAVGVVGLEDGWGPTIPSPAFPPGCEGAALSSGEGAFTPDGGLSTLLHYLESQSVAVDWDDATGGAIEPLCDGALVVTPWGRIALARSNGAVDYLDGRVPMNLEGLTSHQDSATFHLNVFRVADVLLAQRAEELYELFVTHQYYTGECIRFRLSSTTILWQAGAASVSPGWRTIFDADPCLSPQVPSGRHSGGKMLTDGPGHLLVVIGDHIHNNGWIAQNPESHLGKLVRVAIDSGEAEILAFGLRNPQGFARDAEGNLWEAEHGPLGGDELNVLEPGSNYGWPSASYGIDYDRRVSLREWETAGRHEGFVKPRFAWVPSIAVSAVIVNDERWFPLWEDDLLVASLSGAEGSGNALFRVRRNGTDVQYVERIEVGYRIRDLTQTPDGRIAALADGGRVHFLSLSSARCDEESRRREHVYAVGCAPLGAAGAGAPDPGGGPPATDPPPPPVGGDADEAVAASGAQLYAARCEVCHSLVSEQHGIGPHLVGLIGRRIGEADGWNSSEALRALGGVWTRGSLARFLADPQGFAPGTTMGEQGLSESEAGAVADYIAGLRGE